MPSVILSARKSTASVFDMFSVTAGAITKTIETAARGIDMLDEKTSLMHERVVVNCKLQRINMESEEIITAANEHVDLLEEAFRRNNPTVPFDRAKHYAEAVAKMEAALKTSAP